MGPIGRSAWSQVVSWPGEQDGDKWEASRRSHVSWKHSSFSAFFALGRRRIRLYTDYKGHKCFPLVPKNKDSQLWRQEQAKSQFFQMCLPPGKQPTVCLLSLSVCQMRFWPLGSPAAPPTDRSAELHAHLAATSHTSPPFFPKPPPLFPLSPPFFASANYKHMRPCGSTDCCQTSRLLFLLSSALWHAGRFILPPWKEPQRSV